MLQSTWSPQINWAFVRKKLESEVWHYTRLEARWPIRIAKALYLPLLCMRYPQLIGKLLRG